MDILELFCSVDDFWRHFAPTWHHDVLTSRQRQLRGHKKSHLCDARRRHWFQAGVVAIPVTHPDYEQSLWLVVSRPGKGRPPWYVLTTEAITGEDDA
jgi:hypothetical protein